MKIDEAVAIAIKVGRGLIALIKLALHIATSNPAISCCWKTAT